jgi:uridine phosphorylase
MKGPVSETELVLNPDGSVYHLHLKGDDIADTVILVGNPKRVTRVSGHFDTVEKKVANREFVTHIGQRNGKRIAVIGCGIGTDNIDIVLNELYAATQFDSNTRLAINTPRTLDIIRLGTSGAIQPDIEVGSFLASSHGLGVDGLMYYYKYAFSAEERALGDAFAQTVRWPEALATPYFTTADCGLLDTLGTGLQTGITVAATGFYGPQGRFLHPNKPDFNLYDTLRKQEFGKLRVTNFDMETAALYGLGNYFGFRCVTVNVIIANRATETFSNNPKEDVDKLIRFALERLEVLH